MAGLDSASIRFDSDREAVCVLREALAAAGLLRVNTPALAAAGLLMMQDLRELQAMGRAPLEKMILSRNECKSKD